MFEVLVPFAGYTELTPLRAQYHCRKVSEALGITLTFQRIDLDVIMAIVDSVTFSKLLHADGLIDYIWILSSDYNRIERLQDVLVYNYANSIGVNITEVESNYVF